MLFNLIREAANELWARDPSRPECEKQTPRGKLAGFQSCRTYLFLCNVDLHFFCPSSLPSANEGHIGAVSGPGCQELDVVSVV